MDFFLIIRKLRIYSSCKIEEIILIPCLKGISLNEIQKKPLSDAPLEKFKVIN
jgi:hypothetical protein